VPFNTLTVGAVVLSRETRDFENGTQSIGVTRETVHSKSETFGVPNIADGSFGVQNERCSLQCFCLSSLGRKNINGEEERMMSICFCVDECGLSTCISKQLVKFAKSYIAPP
jgi:hypothetical protein